MGGEVNAQGKSRSSLPKLARFDVLRRLGEGGEGLVYEAVDRERAGRVALKMLRRIDADALLRLKDEFRSVQDIEHPNLIRLFELLCDRGQWFFTMELIEGARSFVAYVTRVGDDGRAISSDGDPTERTPGTTEPSGKHPRSPRVAVADQGRLRAALRQLAHGLVALHAAGKVHRDVKPHNVLVGSDRRVVLLDFGLTRDADQRSPTDDENMVVGTVPYMAPEQAVGEDVGAAADWYSVGAMLYKCLAGRPPFEGAAVDVLQRKVVEDPPWPHEIAPDVPIDLEALCMELLKRDPVERPTGDEVVRRLEARATADRPSAPVLTHSPFVGRARETEALRAAYADARDGDAVTVIVEGESGVGKTAIVRQLTRSLHEHDRALVLAGRCYEREDVPFKAVDGVVDALSHHLSSLPPDIAERILPAASSVLANAFPVLRRVPAMDSAPGSRSGAFKAATMQESRALLYDAMRDVLGRLRRSRPLVIVIDDLHWADPDSLRLLAELLRPPAPPVLLLATARSSDAAHREGPPFGLPGDVRVLPISGLSPEEGLELVRMLAREITPMVAARIVHEAGGHPLFVDALVRQAQLAGGQTPAGVHLDDALVARVTRLEPEARALLELLSVAGVALPQDTAMRAAGASFADFSRHTQALRAAHLARTHGSRGDDAIEPYHDRVREAVVGKLSAEGRAQCHARLALALEAAPSVDADALSTHCLGAGFTAKAGRYALMAGDQAAAALAFERAARLYQRALEWAPLDDDAKQALRVRIAEMLANAGRGTDAAKAYFDAADRAAPEAALDMRRRAAEELLTAGRLDEGEAALHAVLRAVGLRLPRTPMVALLGLLFFRFLLSLRGLRFQERPAGAASSFALTRVEACNGVGRVLSGVDTIRASYFQARGLLYALALGEPGRLAYALAIEAVYAATGGDAALSAKLLMQARGIGERGRSMQVAALVDMATGYAELVLGRFQEGLAFNDRSAETLREHCPGAYWDLRAAQIGAIWSIGWMGDLNELAARVEQGVREAEHRGDIYLATTLRTGPTSLTWLRRGDAAGTRALVLEATRQWTQSGYHSQHYWSLFALARIDLYEGDGRAAHARVSREWARIERAMIPRIRLMGTQALHLRASAALGAAAAEQGSERARLIRAAERDARRLTRMDWTIAAPFAHLVHAGVSALRGDADRAATELGEAARGFGQSRMGLHLAAARWHLGKLIAGDAGTRLVVQAERWMASQRIVSPARMAGMLAPGLHR
jgi:serine/threonine protein kinase